MRQRIRANPMPLIGGTSPVVKPIEEIRRANLNLLVQEAGNAAKLAVLTDTPPSYISQVSRGVTHPNSAKPRLMGDDVARRMELKMGKPRGWMDADHSAIHVASELNGREGQLIGLFRLLRDVEQAELVNDLTNRLRRPAPPEAAESPTRSKH